MSYDFERINLLLTTIDLAAAVGASHLPFISVAWEELKTIPAEQPWEKLESGVGQNVPVIVPQPVPVSDTTYTSDNPNPAPVVAPVAIPSASVETSNTLLSSVEPSTEPVSDAPTEAYPDDPSTRRI